MQIYIIKVIIKTNGKTISNYNDSVWENKQDAAEHIKQCRKEGIFNEEFITSIEERTIYKHIEE